LAFTQQDLSPYSSHIVARRRGAVKNLDREIGDVIASAVSPIQTLIERPRHVTNKVPVAGKLVSNEYRGPWQVVAYVRSMACVYVEERPVTWLSDSADADRLHHLVMVTMTKGGLMLLTVTDAEHRAELLSLLQAGHFKDWEPVSQSVLLKALVLKQELKTLWLAGVHRDTTIKPSSKILSGKDLREAIDPMNDSSYLAGAVRSKEAGVSLRNSSVWIGPNTSLVSFEARAVKLLGAVQRAIAANPPKNLQLHSSLARWVNNIGDAKKCYFIAHVDPEGLEQGSGRDRAEALAAKFRVELNAPGSPAGKPARAFAAKVTDVATGTPIVVEVIPELAGHQDSVKYKIDPMPAAPYLEWANAVIASPSLLRAYYDTGHTIAAGALSQVRPQDLPFKAFRFLSFSGYNVDQEKPEFPNGDPAPIGDMMTVGDKSLFKWVFKEGLTRLRLGAPAAGTCWIFCDDGGSEVADFVHLDIGSKPKRLTLFHVKAAASNLPGRRSVPGPYEVVSAQAIKNLRALDATALLARIKGRLKKNGAHRVWDALWVAGLPPLANPKPFSDALEDLGKDYDCEVIIVQPHVLKSDYIKGKTFSKTVGAAQLRTLLFGVESVARSVNAKFRVVVDNK
jgi:hypothetical protein